jgi:hypothetical protein
MFESGEKVTSEEVIKVIERLKLKIEPLKSAMFKKQVKIREKQLDEIKKNIQMLGNYLEGLPPNETPQIKEETKQDPIKFYQSCALVSLWVEARLTGKWVIAKATLDNIKLKNIRDGASAKSKQEIDMIKDTVDTLANNAFAISTDEINTLISAHPQHRDALEQIRKKTLKYEKKSSGRSFNFGSIIGSAILFGSLIGIPIFTLHLLSNDPLRQKITPDAIEKHIEFWAKKADPDPILNKLGIVGEWIAGTKKINITLPQKKETQTLIQFEGKQYQIQPERKNEISQKILNLNDKNKQLEAQRKKILELASMMQKAFQAGKYTPKEQEIIKKNFQTEKDQYKTHFEEWTQQKEKLIRELEGHESNPQ